MSRLRAALPLVLLVLAGVVMFFSGAFDQLHPERLVQHQDQLHAQVVESPWLSRIAFIGILTLAMSTGVPGTLLIILAGGFVFGTWEGTAYASIGLTLGTLILYLASRYAFGNGSRHPPALIERIHHGFERHPVAYTLFLRFVPVAPFGLITVCLAWLRCPLWLFLGASWLGGTVSLIFETSIGAGLGEALARTHGHFDSSVLLQPKILLSLGCIALLVLLPLLLERMLRGRLHRSASASRQASGLPPQAD